MRVACFFDGKNFYSGWRGVGQPQISYARLAVWLTRVVKGNTFVGAHYYTGIEAPHNELPSSQGNLSRFLRQIEKKEGFFVHSFARKSARQVCPNCQGETRFTQEKRVDTSLVADMVKLAAVDNYDIAILLSGDEDLLPAVEAAAGLGKQVWVATWGRNGMSTHLSPAAFGHIDLQAGLRNFQNEVSGRVNLNDVSFPPEEDSELQGFLCALQRAEDRFSRTRNMTSGHPGFVGLGYFLTKWEDKALLPDDPEARRAILDALVAKKRITVYDSGTGFKALKINTEWTDTPSDGEVTNTDVIEGEVKTSEESALYSGSGSGEHHAEM
jgi:uncharacterized LabA/DUF88 family protein